MSGDTGEDFDLDSAMDTVAQEQQLHEPADDPAEAPVEAAADTAVETPTEQRPPPKSWAREQHAHWATLPKEAQDYIELRERQMLDGLEQYRGDAGYGKTLKSVLEPYAPVLQQIGMQPHEAIKTLLDSHVRLSSGSPQERRAFLDEIARNYGVDMGVESPPEIQSLRAELHTLRQQVDQRMQHELQTVRARTEREVAQFAEQKPYFDEVADDIIVHLNAGADLEAAYEKAVWANPGTRQKEMARLQEQQKAEAKAEAEAARRAKSVNVGHRDTTREPTVPAGTMEDTMKDTLQKIRDRAH